jgi:arsenate reductase
LEYGRFRIQKEQVDRILYSKTLDAIPRDLPVVAMMTCAEADEACPAIFGAVARIPWRYPDPKIADGMPESRATYRAVAEAIACDLEALYHELKNLV